MTCETTAGDGAGLVRVRLDAAYDGAGFAGWARQPGQRTVQGELERALATVLRLPSVVVTGAGRTDAGVHATGQVLHTDLPAAALAADDRPGDERWSRLLRRVNAVLDDDVRLRACRVAPAGFDARFAAVWRRYAYRVADRPDLVDPLRRGHVLTWPWPLDLAAMNAAAGELVGEHDFAAYCRPRPGTSTVRGLQRLCWRRDDAGLAVLHARADAFCHHLVRALTGALLAVGTGRRPVDWPALVLRERRRDPAVWVAPPHGLTLEEVGYPADEELALRTRTTRRVRQPGPDR